MKNPTINRNNKTIEISKSFEKAASVYGSEEYRILINAQKNHPDFKVVTTSSKKKAANSSKGITYDFMATYISAHDADGSIMKMFRTLRAVDEHDNRIAGFDCASYKEVQNWFFETYPEFEEHRKSIASIINRNSGNHAA